MVDDVTIEIDQLPKRSCSPTGWKLNMVSWESSMLIRAYYFCSCRRNCRKTGIIKRRHTEYDVQETYRRALKVFLDSLVRAELRETCAALQRHINVSAGCHFDSMLDALMHS